MAAISDYISASGTGYATRMRALGHFGVVQLAAWGGGMALLGGQIAHEFGAAGPGHRFARRLGAALLIVSILPGVTPVSTLQVDVQGLRSTRGMIRLCMTADPKNFPGCTDDARAITRSVPATSHQISLDGVAPGSYAVSVIHDENGNAKLDTLAGIPREGFGFSRNPVIMFGPPRFSSARFALAPGESTQLVRMRYFF